jgi:hypothetical protein
MLLPFENVTVSDDGVAIARGIAVGLGNPQQFLALVPSFAADDMFVTNIADCGADGTANLTCLGTIGGAFSPADSDTYVRTTKAQWNGTADYDVDGGAYVFFNDDLRYASAALEKGYPLFMNEPGSSK